ncbi:MAG: hypothetical protein KIT83_04100 [Bryobacterales bacterium]|nr:hypothetical protein [Bryobacterales bacterium]
MKAMALPVPLRELVIALEGMTEESTSYLNLDTGEVFTITHEIMGLAEDLDDSEDPGLPEWQLPELALARSILDSDRYQALPTKFDIHEWAIMQDFARSTTAARAGDELRNVIHGAGAFRRFKETVRRHGIEPAWFQFREETLKQIMREWCAEYDVAFDEADEANDG